MSSLQENNSTVPLDDVVNKRKAAFSRSDSFDKFHYTAFYALQLAGKHSAIFEYVIFLQIFLISTLQWTVCLRTRKHPKM